MPPYADDAGCCGNDHTCCSGTSARCRVRFIHNLSPHTCPHTNTYMLISSHPRTYTNTHAHQNTHRYMYAYAHSYACAYACAYAYAYAYTYTYAYAYAYAFAFAYFCRTLENTPAYQNTRTCIHTYTYTHTDRHRHIRA